MATVVENKTVDVANILADVFEITQELFPGEVSIEVVTDPEHPDTRFTSIVARASGPVEDVVDRQGKWHERISRLCGPSSRLCLGFNFQK